MTTAKYHLPGLFEFFEFYKVFLPIYGEHREYFYDWAEISSIYGAPEGCTWGGGRFGDGDACAEEVLGLLEKYGISGRLTFSNSLLDKEHLSDKKCNKLCVEFENGVIENGVIVHSELLLEYLRENYPGLYFVSSTTKVLTEFLELKNELSRDEFRYVVPDFRLNKFISLRNALSQAEKDRIELLVNECCYIGCMDRKACYENVSRRMLDGDTPEHICRAPGGSEGYKFSEAMKNPAFIGTNDIIGTYLPAGLTNFKIEGRGLGTAVVLEMILYYMVKPEYQLNVREMVYLDSELDLF